MESFESISKKSRQESNMSDDIKAEVFEILSKGIVVSLNSDRYFEIANFLNVDDNFEIFDEIVNQIGYQLIGENGYFYLARKRRMESAEIESFVTAHKRVILAISILKEIYPLISAGDTITFVDFVKDMQAKESDLVHQKMQALFDAIDERSAVEEFFKLLEKHFVLESIRQQDKNSYRVLNSIGYFVAIVERVA
jgi:hypothetical protein